MNVLTGAIAGTKYFVVIDNNGNLKTITNIQEVKPGEVLLTKGDDPMMSGTFINAEIVEEDGSVTPIDVQSEVDQIIAQLEGGQDPTLLGEEFATAAGESSGSSVTPMAVVARDGTEVIASTSFDTTGIESQGLSRTQSLQLLQQFINDAPTVSLSNLIVSIDENTPTNESIRVADINIVDDEQGINELSLSGTDADKFIIVTNADGTYELHLLPGVVLDFETLSSMDVSVNVSDPVLSDAALDTDSMTLGVNDVNEAPVSAVAINVTTQEDEPITMTLAELLADVLDPDNDSLTVSNLRATDEGTVIRENVDGTFTIIPGENFNGQIDLVFDVSDGELTVEREINLTVTPVADPGVVTVEPITADDIINILESQAAIDSNDSIMVSGTAIGGDIKVGDPVSMTINGTLYETTVGEGGVWSVPVEGSDLAENTVFTVNVVSTDGESTVTSSAISEHQVDIDLSVPTIDLIDSSDSGDSNTDNLTNQTKPTFALGNIDSDVSPDKIVVSIDGIAVAGVFATVNGVLQFTPSEALAEELREVVVTVSDDAGNTKSSAVLEVTIDTVAEATISIDVIAGDDIVNAAEGAGTVLVTGTVGGDAQPGDEVTLTVAGNEYKGQVNSDGTYRINVPGADLLNDSDKIIEASVSGEDTAGNPFTVRSVSSGNEVDGNYQVEDTPLVTIEGNGNDNIEGNDGNDVLVGDLGVRTGHSPTKSYNIAIIIDESGSMTREMPIVRSALSDLVANLASYQGVIHLSLIGFHSQAAIDIESTDISGDLSEIQTAIDGLTASGGTYYHTAFEKADAWFDSEDRVEGENKVIFLTDGKTRSANKAHEEFENLIDASENDVSVRAIAVDDGSSNWVDKLEEYDNTPIAGSDSGIEIVSDDDSIRAALDISTLKLDPAGNDTIRGNEGDDFILGDVINAANLWGGINNVPQSYENFTSEQLISIWMKNINGAEPTENEMNQFILANKDVLTASSIGETETGGNDFLYGGDGNDTIYGQVGNDELFGEEGNDLLSGGLGNDILTGGEGNDTFIWTEDTLDSGTDIIRDFQLNSDKIDISDLMDLSDPQKDSIDDILSSVTVDGTNVKIQFNTQSNNQTIVLEGGVTALGLDSSAYPDGSTVDLTSSLMDQVFKYD